MIFIQISFLYGRKDKTIKIKTEKMAPINYKIKNALKQLKSKEKRGESFNHSK